MSLFRTAALKIKYLEWVNLCLHEKNQNEQYTFEAKKYIFQLCSVLHVCCLIDTYSHFNMQVRMEGIIKIQDVMDLVSMVFLFVCFVFEGCYFVYCHVLDTKDITINDT